jgi:HNH endonuclease/AP2 domain
MRTRPRLTPERLREVLHYDPETGEFRWLQRVSSAFHIGDLAGSLSHRYRCIRIDGRTYTAHQLAWLYMKGEWGRPMIDHRDRDPTNNRWDNLRLATFSHNSANRRRHRNNTSGFKGVRFDRQTGKWIARIWKDGRAYFLGRFATPQAAHEAYAAAAHALYGEFARAE